MESLEFDSKISTIRKEEEEKRHSPYKMYGIPGYAGCQLTCVNLVANATVKHKTFFGVCTVNSLLFERRWDCRIRGIFKLKRLKVNERSIQT